MSARAQVLTTKVPLSKVPVSKMPLTQAAGIPASVSAYLLFAAVALAPLPYGSYELTFVVFWCVVLGICLVLAPVPHLGGRQLALVGLAMAVVVGYAMALHEQLATHPWFGTANIDPIWQQAAAALGEPIPPSVSIVRNQPWFELGRPFACLLAIVCGFLIGSDNDYARRLLKVIAWSGAGYAVYGILAHLFDPTQLLWRDKEAYLGSVTGTFINRNTAGAYFGSCAVIWSVLIWERLRLEMPRGAAKWRGLQKRILARAPRKLIIASAMMLLCLTAMFMSVSRAAVVLSLFAGIVAFIAFFWRDLPGRAGLLMALSGAAAIVLLLLQLMGGSINQSFNLQGAGDEGRLEAYRGTLGLIANHPWFGTGQGTFAYVFPAYRSDKIPMWGVWDIAHNTLLEIAADMGVPVAILVAIAWIAIFAVLIYGVRTRRRHLAIPVAALAVGLISVPHSLVDFTLQIPGYSIMAMPLIGAGLAQSLAGAQSRRDGGPVVGSAEKSASD